jgi:hypothetical protein
MTQIDYKKVFSKLSHIKALSHDQKFEQVVQNLITYSLLNCTTSITTETELTENIRNIYGISIRLNIIQSNLDKLLDNGALIRDKLSKNITLSNLVAEKIRQRIRDDNSLELKVKTKWLYEITQLIPEIPENKYGLLWKNLTDYLYNVFEQHGIETLTLLNPSLGHSVDDQKSLSSILDKVLRDNNNDFSKEALAQAINQFILKADEERTDYISQLVDATFTSFALTSDADTVNFLNNRFQNLLLFLDTNFIFGILDLHKNNEDASAKEILAEIKKNSFPFKLTYHPETLAEFKRAFDSKALLIKSTKWSRETSRIAIEVDGLSPLEELYHNENIKNNIDPDVFLDKYDHVDLIIKDLGLVEHTVAKAPAFDSAELEEDIENYQKFYEANRNRKFKTYQGFKHDIEVLREVRALNHRKTKFLESKAFFISSDYVLSKFEKDYYKKRWEINFIISPSTFLQLIRPFIQNDYVANKKFIDTFSIPDLRSFEIDYTTTRSKTLQILNDNYHDTSFQTKVNILRDQVLLDKFDKLNHNQLAQVELIENKIALENQLLSQQKQEAENKIETISQEMVLLESSKIQVQRDREFEISQLRNELDKVKETLKNEQTEKAYLLNLDEWYTKKQYFVVNQMKEKEKEYSSDAKYCIRPIISIIVFAFTVFVLSKYYEDIKQFVVPEYLSSKWFVIVVLLIGFANAVELASRTYISDKAKVKNGYIWILTFGLNSRKVPIIEPYKLEYEKDFDKNEPKPIRQT